MSRLSMKTSLATRVTLLLIGSVSIGIIAMAGLGYWKVYEVTAENAEIRIDRAARAATNILVSSQNGTFSVIKDQTDHPKAIQIVLGSANEILQFRPEYDDILKQIGATNQGAANLFKFNAETLAFDRFATTFRRPDGSMPPPMSIKQGHPAFANLASNVQFVGEVPVMGRMRLAYLMPINDVAGEIVGALAVDVGWADDLIVARTHLRNLIVGFAVSLLSLVGLFGIMQMRREMQPLGNIAKFANDVASGHPHDEVPHKNRNDEIGLLAEGLGRVVKLQERLKYLAYTDPLTGQGNRERYFQDLKAAAKSAADDQKCFAIFHLDIDRFSKVNDGYGEDVGDALLIAFANELVVHFGELAMVSRVGGDDFCIILPHDCDAERLAHLCQTLIDRLVKPISLRGGDIHIDTSCGIAVIPEDTSDFEAAHRNAGLALRMAKQAGMPGFAFYSEGLDEAAQRHILIEELLREALETDGLTLDYQAQICPRTYELFGLEALARWNHPTEGKISPGEFIPVAEKAGLIIELGNWVLNEGCRQAKQWVNEGLNFGHVSVNVSPLQLSQPGFATQVKNCLEYHDLDTERLCLEVTESVFVDADEDRICDILESLKVMGLHLALDDFGTGYSSLGYLNRLPFEQLKIDRCFIADVHLDAQKRKLLQGMVGLGKGLGMRIVAEGAEVVEEVSILFGLKVDAVQGFYFARPVPPECLPMTLDQIAELAEKNSAIVDDISNVA